MAISKVLGENPEDSETRLKGLNVVLRDILSQFPEIREKQIPLYPIYSENAFIYSMVLVCGNVKFSFFENIFACVYIYIYISP